MNIDTVRKPYLAPYRIVERDVALKLRGIMIQYLKFTDFDTEILRSWDALRCRHKEYPLRHWIFWEFDILLDDEIFADDSDSSWFKLKLHLLNRDGPSIYLSWLQEYFLARILGARRFGLKDKRFSDDDFDEWTGSITNIYPIHIAALIGDARLCTELIARGEHVDYLSALGTPLHCAILGSSQFEERAWWQCNDVHLSKPRHEAAVVLLEAGADP